MHHVVANRLDAVAEIPGVVDVVGDAAREAEPVRFVLTDFERATAV